MSSLESFLSSDLIRAFGWALLHSLWQGAVIALMALLAIALQRKHSPKLRYATFTGLLLLIPISFLVTFALVYGRGAGIHPESMDQHLAPYALGAVVPDSLKEADTNSLSAWLSGVNNFFEENMHWLFLLWFGGLLAFLARFAGSMVYIYRLRTSRLMDASNEMQNHLLDLSKELKLSKLVRLKESALVKVPMTIGYLKPVILFPIGLLSGLPTEQVDAILLHELAHIYRKDYILNIIQSFIEMLFFYHPVTWWLSGLIRVEREHVCDDIVLSIHHDRINYIKALTAMEELNVKSPVLATALTGPRKKLLYRVTRLLHPEKLSKGFSEGIVGFLVLLTIVIAVSANALTYSNSGRVSPGQAAMAGYSLVLPTSYDLTGRESGEKVLNYLPSSFANSTIEPQSDPSEVADVMALAAFSGTPDTVVHKSESGKTIVTVIRDTTDNGKEKHVSVILDTKEDLEGDKGADGIRKEKVVTMTIKGDGGDKETECIVIKDGDSVRVIKHGDDCSGHSGVFQWHSIPPVPDMPGIPEHYFFYGDPDDSDMTHMYFNFNGDSLDSAGYTFNFSPGEFNYSFNTEEMEEAMRAYEKAMEESQFEWNSEDMDRAMEEYEHQMKDHQLEMEELQNQQKELQERMEREHIFVYPQGEPMPPMEWHSYSRDLPGHSTEKIIRQELREDGLVDRNRSYVIEITPKAMYINGEKQSKEVAKKYMHLVQGLEPGILEDGGTYKIVF